MSYRQEEKRKDTRKAKGMAAEQAAAAYLQSLGYRIIARNWRCRSGELDIIAEHSETLIIVEVRSRSAASSAFGTPAESITARKIRQVRETAAVYLHQMQGYHLKVRFDVVAVLLDKSNVCCSVEHIQNAF
ncbi:YraN family protein [Paenibacillus sp. CAA11]|uniref:YraN family protein n=1 Tax=Paenibacillus sp. CAA11 TaxID=1532905 RepID=UPI000D3899E9|nr:YraN family protein [Paenibacillus sp. CAA11]AWB44278.1 YraN family protein [Paenibacillus sp. CAA11]